eukprot:2079306-Pleurochrysis_carterae.AAC.2
MCNGWFAGRHNNGFVDKCEAWQEAKERTWPGRWTMEDKLDDQNNEEMCLLAREKAAEARHSATRGREERSREQVNRGKGAERRNDRRKKR